MSVREFIFQVEVEDEIVEYSVDARSRDGAISRLSSEDGFDECKIVNETFGWFN